MIHDMEMSMKYLYVLEIARENKSLTGISAGTP